MGGLYDTMAKTNIIQKLCETVDDKKILEVKEYKKQNEELHKWYEQLEKYIKEDKELYNIYYNIDMEEGLCEGIANEIYYREGFLCGARLALEICGVKTTTIK